MVPPTPTNTKFDLRASTISMIQNNAFHGLPSEDPFAHLTTLNQVSNTFRINGLTEDHVMLRLFPLFLKDKAARWFDGLPSQSITTWNQCQ